jgi:hypothetical protein
LRGWLKHSAISQKVVGSILECVIGIVQLHNPSGCIRALGLTQTLTFIITNNVAPLATILVVSSLITLH